MTFRIFTRIIPYIFLFVIVSMGFLFRLKGIQDNHSFWADEGYIASFARDIVTGKTTIFQGIQKVWYQPLQILITALFFKLFGISEFSARLPSVIFGMMGIIFAFLVARRLSNVWGGLSAAFIYGFSQLNLANATQSKPYTAITTLSFLILYLCIKRGYTHLWIILLLIGASLFHISGLLIWIPYIVILLSRYSKLLKGIIQKPIALFTIILILFLGFYIFGIRGPYNNTMYLKNLLLKQYGLFFICFLLSFILLWKKYRLLVVGLAIYIFLLLFLWNFRQYSPNIRYLVPFFGIMFVFFGVFWGKVGERLKNLKFSIFNFQLNGTLIPSLFVIIVLIVTQYKIILKPMSYYSPNADFYGDVQIADYKSMFGYIKKKYPLYKDIAIFNSSPDAQRWYLEKLPDAYFVKKSANYYIFTFDNPFVYSGLEKFINEKSKYPRGILIVEDWESFLPEDIKEYAKKNMKLEFRVESLPQAKNDPWPLEVHSWGMN